MPWILTGLVALIGLFAVLLLAQWGLIVFVVLAVPLGLYLLVGRRRDPSFGSVESGRRSEPTGTPRKASGGVETANDRVG